MGKTRERIYLNKHELERIEIDILNRRHIERYAMLRQWCNGVVLDVACGCGYGTYLMSKNPDVDKILAYDIDKEAIKWAKENFEDKKIEFFAQDISDILTKADQLICLETIEHLKTPKVLNDMALRCGVKEIFVSYPSKKTTHYNKHHYHDFVDQDVVNIFSDYKIIEVIDLHREVRIMKFKK